MNTYIFIHGGEAFADQSEYRQFITSTLVDWNLESLAIGKEKKKWKIALAKKLAEQGDRVYIPDFPNPLNAHYEEWKIFFETWIEKIQIEGTLTLIGHSLGGNFLLKYFGEINIQNSIFVIPRYEESAQKTTKSEQIVPIVSMIKAKIHIDAVHLVATCIKCGNFLPADNYKVLKSLESKVHIWHAEDDMVVPFTISKELGKDLPDAIIHFFGSEIGYGHFHGIERFPELESAIFKK